MKVFKGRQVNTTSAATARTVELPDDKGFLTVREVAAEQLEKFPEAVGVEVNLTVKPLFRETRDL